MRRAPPPSLTAPPRPAPKRPYFYERLGEGERGAFELRVPGRKGRPETVISYGRMATAPQNNAPEHASPDNGRVLDLGPTLGCVTVRGRRARRPDGSLGPMAPVRANVSKGGLTSRPDLDAERSARSDIEQALKAFDKGRESHLALAPKVRLVRDSWGVLTTIPDRGKIIHWGSMDDLVWALARRQVY